MTTAGGAPMVGRAEPRRRIEAAISASSSGRQGVVLVSGESGMGKTTLIRTCMGSASGDPIIGWGTCWQGEGAPGFWPWTQAFDDVVASVGTEAAIRAARHDRELLSVVVRPLSTNSEQASVADGDRVLLLDAIVRWLETLAIARQVIVVLDDLQWADPSSLVLLDQIAGSSRSSKLLIVGGYRHDEIDDQRRAPLTRISSRSDHIRLTGLTAGGVAALTESVVGSVLTSTQLADIHRRTGGHPLFVVELARLAALGDDSLPAVVTDAVARRLEALPVKTRTAIDAASVLGNQILLDVVAQATRTTSDETADALDAAVDAGVVQRGTDSTLRFAHDLFRETLYNTLSRKDRTALHAAVATGLESRSTRGGRVEPGALARHHAAAISLVGTEAAIESAFTAAKDERNRSAFREAAFHLTRARTSAMNAGLTIEPSSLVTLLKTEAEDMARDGSPDEARSLLHSAAAIAPGPSEQADVALAVQRLGSAFAVRRDEMITQLTDALSSVTGTDPIREARLTAALARELQHSVPEDRARAVPLSKHALSLGRSVGDDATVADCLLARHDALWGPGTGVERAELGREIAEVGSRLRDTDRHAEGLLLQANGLLESGSPLFRPVLDRWFAILEHRDQPRDRYMVLTRRTAIALIEGRIEDADALMHEAAVVGATIHEPDTGNVLMSHRVAFARALDDPEEHHRLAVDAVAHWTGTPVHAHSVAAGALAAAGDLDAAAREVAMAADAGGWQSEGSYLRSVLVGHLAEAAVALRDLPLCRALLDEVEPLTGSCGVNGAVVAFAGPFDHTAGILASALGQNERARFLLERSVATSRLVGAEPWVRSGESVLAAIAIHAANPDTSTSSVDPANIAELHRTGGIWSVHWRNEVGSVRHVKGMADIAQLVASPGREIPALALANPSAPPAGADHTVIDLEALAAYRTRLDQIDRELDDADSGGDLGRLEMLRDEREALLGEVRTSTGLGGRLRTMGNEPSERARKAVSARIRDAINRLEGVAPELAGHLNRSISTGLKCSYNPSAGEPRIKWQINHTQGPALHLRP